VHEVPYSLEHRPDLEFGLVDFEALNLMVEQLDVDAFESKLGVIEVVDQPDLERLGVLSLH